MVIHVSWITSPIGDLYSEFKSMIKSIWHKYNDIYSFAHNNTIAPIPQGMGIEEFISYVDF